MLEISRDLPYILGWSQLTIATIDCNLGLDTIVEFDSITVQKAEAIKTFYNPGAFLC